MLEASKMPSLPIIATEETFQIDESYGDFTDKGYQFRQLVIYALATASDFHGFEREDSKVTQ